MKCIFCDLSKNFNDEHIIPESIGGNIIINNVCVDCNSKFGSEIDIKLTRNKHIYDSYRELSKEFNLNLEFSFNDAYYQLSNGQKVKAVKRSKERKALINKIAKNEFITDKDEERFYIQYLRNKGKQKNLSEPEINKVIDDFKHWNRNNYLGEDFYNELFELTIKTKEDNVSFNYIMDVNTPHRYLAKACVEFAYLFNIANKIKNIEILKAHALKGNQLQNISLFQEVHKEITPCPFHFIRFENTQFIMILFCQFNFALDIEWEDKPINLRFANNLVSKKFVHCILKDGRLKSTNREFIQEVT